MGLVYPNFKNRLGKIVCKQEINNKYPQPINSN